MAEPADMIVPLLREMKADIERRFSEAGDIGGRRHAQVIARLDKLEEQQRSFRHALGADSLLSKLVTGEFEERIVALERKMQELQS